MTPTTADIETLTIHGRPAEQIIPYFSQGARLLVLTQDGGSPEEVSRLLIQNCYGASCLSVLDSLGGEMETTIGALADEWHLEKVCAFHVLAVECQAVEGAKPNPRVGIADDAFQHDGQITIEAGAPDR